jgi:hypothetical protein
MAVNFAVNFLSWWGVRGVEGNAHQATDRLRSSRDAGLASPPGVEIGEVGGYQGERPGDRARRRPVIAGEHDDANAFRFQRGQCFGRRCLHRIGDGDNAGSSAINAGIDSCGAGLPELIGLRIKRTGFDALVFQKAAGAEDDPSIVNGAESTFAGWGVESAHRRK